MHNGQLGTEKFFKKIEFDLSMARLAPNLVNTSQITWKKKRKKVIEIGKFRTPNQPQMNKKWLNFTSKRFEETW